MVELMIDEVKERKKKKMNKGWQLR